MRIGYVTTYDPRDRAQWSGLGYHVAQALRQHTGHCVEELGALHKGRPLHFLRRKLLYGLRRQGYLADRDTAIVKGFSKQASEKLAALGKPVDVVLSPGTIPVAYLESPQPLVVWTDSCFAAMIDFYPDFTNLCAETLRSGDEIEAAALGRADLLIYSSDWAARTARQSYGVPEHKIRVVPFGANLDVTPTEQDVRCMIAARSSEVCKLVFLGVDWYRKGGDQALEVARTLNERGIPTTLVIAGSRPKLRGADPSWLQDVGTINKRSASRTAALTTLLGDAHFLILPTRADCTPVTFSEANAFGVPCLASRVGGVPSIIRDGYNGATFALGDTDAYCDFIAETFCKPARYQALARSAHHEYASRLNWQTAAATVSGLLEDLA